MLVKNTVVLDEELDEEDTSRLVCNSDGMSSEFIDAVKNGLSLHIPDKNVQDSVVPLHWCVSKELHQRIKELNQRIKELKGRPYLLIVTAPLEDRNTYGCERRWLVPL